LFACGQGVGKVDELFDEQLFGADQGIFG